MNKEIQVSKLPHTHSLSRVSRTAKYIYEVLLPLLHSWDSIYIDSNSDLITKRHSDSANREMKRLTENKSVSANTRLTNSKSNLIVKVYSDSTKPEIKKR
jgi:hypothetical protein